MLHLGRSGRVILRSMLITLFILTCAVTAVLLMGRAYSAMQRDVFGVEAKAFWFSSKDHVTVFGKEIYFPLITLIERAVGFFQKHCSGLIKLLGYVISTTKELGNIILDLFNQ